MNFVCPWHGYEYDIKTGECVRRPAAAPEEIQCRPPRRRHFRHDLISADTKGHHHGTPAQRKPPHEGRRVRLRQDAGARRQAGEAAQLRPVPDRRRRLASLRARVVQRDPGIHARPGDEAARPDGELRQLQGRRRDAGRRRLSGHGRPRDALSAAPHREAGARRASRRVADAALDGRHGRRHRRAVPVADAAARPASAGRGRGRARHRLQSLARRARAGGGEPHPHR